MSSGWTQVIEGNAASDLTARRLVAQLRACEVSSLAFCRLLERWGRGDAMPATPGGRQAALRRAADRVETALAKTSASDAAVRAVLEKRDVKALAEIVSRLR